MSEHLEDAQKRRSDSHILKHWTNHHGGRETKFTFEIIKFFRFPLEREVGEAVRIERTGAKQILNSKSMFSRNPLPRIIAKDSAEPTNLGDQLEAEPRNQEEQEPVARMSKRALRLESLKDKLNWGQQEEEDEEPEALEEVEVEGINHSILSESDEDLILSYV